MQDKPQRSQRRKWLSLKAIPNYDKRTLHYIHRAIGCVCNAAANQIAVNDNN